MHESCPASAELDRERPQLKPKFFCCCFINHCTCSVPYRITLIPSKEYANARTRARARTHTHTHTHTHTQTHTNTHTYTCARGRAHTRTERTHPRTHARTHPRCVHSHIQRGGGKSERENRSEKQIVHFLFVNLDCPRTLNSSLCNRSTHSEGDQKIPLSCMLKPRS